MKIVMDVKCGCELLASAKQVMKGRGLNQKTSCLLCDGRLERDLQHLFDSSELDKLEE